MLEKNKTVLNMNKKEVISMIKQLFDANIEDLPEDFAQIDPLLFYTETLKEKEKRGYHQKINIPCNYMVDKSELIVGKIEEARKKLTGIQFDELWKCFDFTLDISVWGSSLWEPRILPNGAVLIRNIQKVIGINEQVEDKLQIYSSHIKKDLEEVTEYLKNKKPLPEDDTISFSILHRDENGFIWTQKIPNTLSEVGQTLVFLSKDFMRRLKKSGKINPKNHLLNDKLINIAESSASEHCVLRIFRNFTFIHSTYRLDDDYDTILESYSYRLGDDIKTNDYIKKEVSTVFDFVKSYIKKTVHDENPEIYQTETIKQNRFIKVLLSDKIHEDYTSQKAWQIDEVRPIFGHYWDRPVSYYGENTQFWNIAQLNKGYMFLVNLNFSHIQSSNKSLEEFKQLIEKTVSQVKDPNLKIMLHLPLRELSYLSEEDVFDYKTPECNSRMEVVMKEISKNTVNTITFEESAKYENEEMAEKEFLAMSGVEYKFSILFLTQGIPNIEKCHEYGINISKVMNTSLTIHIPNYGYNQGYSSGYLDEGNHQHFSNFIK